MAVWGAKMQEVCGCVCCVICGTNEDGGEMNDDDDQNEHDNV